MGHGTETRARCDTMRCTFPPRQREVFLNNAHADTPTVCSIPRPRGPRKLAEVAAPGCYTVRTMCCLDALSSSLAQSERIAPRLTSIRDSLQWGLFRPVLAAVNVLHRPAAFCSNPQHHSAGQYVCTSVWILEHNTASSSCGAWSDLYE